MSTLRDGFVLASVLICLAAGPAHAGGGNLEEATALLGRVPAQFREYQVVLEPDKDQPEWWAGAPSVVRDPRGTFWLACRMRTAEAPRGLRGYEIRILRSRDGIHFEKAHSIRREDVPIPGFERPACVVPVAVGYLFIYEGSNCDWFDPVYNIATDLGFTFDLHHITDLTPDGPLVVSTTPGVHFRTWRYSHWLWVDGEPWAYAEVAKPNESNEIRLFRLSRWAGKHPFRRSV